MTSERYPHLFEPIQFGRARLKNRIIQASLTNAAARDGRVTERMLNFYGARAQGGTAMIVTEALAGHSRQFVGHRVRAMDEDTFEGLQSWADAVVSQDCLLLGQIMDSGRGRHRGGRGHGAIGPSPFPDDLSWTVPHELRADEIRRMTEEFTETARRLQRAGFSGVELSCAHGHLFHQFLSPQSNRREDAYGGTTENRTRMVRDLCDAVRASCGAEFVLGIKLVGDDGVPGGIGPEDAVAIAQLLVPHDPDYIAFAQGAHHRSLEMHVPDRTYPPLPYRGITRLVKEAGLPVPVVYVGRASTPADAEALIASGECDAVMMARALLADPDLVAKTKAGEEDAIRLCINCNTCWGQTVSGNPIACDVNPRVGLAGESRWSPASVPASKRVVVIGAGPAGLEAAWVAAARGCEVTVFGAGSDAGGKLRLNATLPGCGQIARAYAFQLARARDAGVRMQLGQKAAVTDIVELDPDHVLLATGAEMQFPEGWTAEAQVPDARAMVRDLANLGEGRRPGTAVLVDLDHSAGTYDLADALAARYERLVIVTPRESVAQDVATVVRQRVYRRLAEARAVLLTLHEVVASNGDRVMARNVYSGEVMAIHDVAAVTYSSWRKPSDELAAPLSGAGFAVTRIGDCRLPSPLLHCLAEGHFAALGI